MHFLSIFLMSFLLCSSVSLLQGCTSNHDPKVVFPKREKQFPDPFIKNRIRIGGLYSQINWDYMLRREFNPLLWHPKM